MDTLTLQVVARGAHASGFTRSGDRPLLVGRGFGNDIVLDDPYVAPEQLRFERVEGQWTVSVLDDTNPVLLNGQAMPGGTATLASGDRIRIGRTDLRVHSADHPVEPTRKLLLASWAGPGRVGPGLAFGLLAAVVVLDAAVDYFQFSLDGEWVPHGYAALVATGVILAWTGLWSVAGRVLRQQAHFLVQLVAGSLVYLGLVAVYPLADYLEFASGSVAVGEVVAYATSFLFLYALLRLNLFFATNIRNTSRVALIVAFAAVGLAFATLRYANDGFTTEPDYSGVVKAPASHMTGDSSVEALTSAARALELD